MLSGPRNEGPDKKRDEGGAPAGPGAVAGDLSGTLRESVGLSFDPERYRELNLLVQSEGWTVLTETIDFGARSCVVDLGSGHGGNTAALAQRLASSAGRVIGIEASEAMVGAARTHHPHVVFLEGRAETADGALKAYEQVHGETLPAITHVVSNYTLHWVRDPAHPDRFLHGEMFRRLNRRQEMGGEQHHFCAETEAFSELFKAGYDLIAGDARWRERFPADERGSPWRHPRLVDEGEISKAFTEAGYEGTVERRTDERIFRSAAELTGWAGAMIRPFMDRIPGAERGDFAAAWIARYMNDNPGMVGPGGAVKLLDRNLLVRVKKIAELAD